MTEILLSEEDLMLRKTVREFAERELAPHAAEVDEREVFRPESFRGIASLGLFGMTLHPRHGGSGGSYRSLAIVIEELARVCAATSVGYLAHLSLATQTINTFGTEGQKARFIPPMARGEKIGAFCLTEPGAGSDAAAVQTTATKADGGYVLNGSKTFITNGDIADTYVVFATTDKTLGYRGFVALVVERESRGLSSQKLLGKMGLRGSDTAQVFFDNVAVSEENRLGEEGRGFRVAMTILTGSRISIAAQSVGIGQAAYESAVRYAKERKAFGHPIAELQALQFMLADMATRLDAARLLTQRAAALRDSGQAAIKECSMAKLYASETAVFCADRAVQIHGGYGYFRPNPVERFFRDARVTTIYEGTSEIQRTVIARQLLETVQ